MPPPEVRNFIVFPNLLALHPLLLSNLSIFPSKLSGSPTPSLFIQSNNSIPVPSKCARETAASAGLVLSPHRSFYSRIFAAAGPISSTLWPTQAHAASSLASSADMIVWATESGDGAQKIRFDMACLIQRCRRLSGRLHFLANSEYDIDPIRGTPSKTL
jgi:hypothetical protein